MPPVSREENLTHLPRLFVSKLFPSVLSVFPLVATVGSNSLSDMSSFIGRGQVVFIGVWGPSFGFILIGWPQFGIHILSASKIWRIDLIILSSLDTTLSGRSSLGTECVRYFTSLLQAAVKHATVSQ